MAESGAVIDKSARRLVPWPAKEGVFNALETWKVGNDDGATFDCPHYIHLHGLCSRRDRRQLRHRSKCFG